MTLLDIIGLLAAFSTTISFLPQAIKTIRTKDTSGISMLMYAVFTIGTLLWLIYGIMLPSFPVALANAITFVLAAVILVYKVRYK